MGTVSHKLTHKEPYCAGKSMESARRMPNTWGGSGHVTSKGGRGAGVAMAAITGQVEMDLLSILENRTLFSAVTITLANTQMHLQYKLLQVQKVGSARGFNFSLVLRKREMTTENGGYTPQTDLWTCGGNAFHWPLFQNRKKEISKSVNGTTIFRDFFFLHLMTNERQT